MFFGKKEPEKVKAEALARLLASLFDKKLGQFEARARSITGEMRQARLKFGDVCKAFEELDAEPYLGGIPFANVNSIKSQKSQYTGVLRNVVDKMSLDVDDSLNPYDRYRVLLSNVDSITNEVLRTNASFKIVLYCYPNHLENFQRSFSTIVKSREALRREIDSRTQEASEYAALSERISMLDIEVRELGELERSLDALKEIRSGGGSSALDKDESSFSESLAGRRAELSSISGELAKLSERIHLLTLPLERPSKKLDHASSGKRQLHPFMVDPMGSIGNEGDYKDFTTMVRGLKEAVEKGTVETKNKEGTLNLIYTLMDADLYGYISTFRSLQIKRSGIEAEVRMLESMLNKIRKGKEDSGKAVQDIESIEGRIKETKGSMASTKSEIETMFMDYCRKPISITL
jgi:chromosome segregation ATPase